MVRDVIVTTGGRVVIVSGALTGWLVSGLRKIRKDVQGVTVNMKTAGSASKCTVLSESLAM